MNDPCAPEALTHVLTEDPVVALTFDDGPDPVYTPRLLDILATHRARATFFMIGVRAHQHPELVARVAAEGHVIGNHAWNHPSFPLISREERCEQIQACALAIAPYGEQLFRPPYGHQDLTSWLDVDQMGYRVVAWRTAAGDWESRDGPSMAEVVMRRLEPGEIVLFHDGLFDAPDDRFFARDSTLAAVELLLDRLAGRLQFVTIPELLQLGVPQYKRWTFTEDKEELNRLTPQDGSARRY
jgi:peptidoglycan-N-acetylglucosamine deacetylase